MISSFKEHIESNFPFLFDGRSIIAVSGGVDSVVLTYLCKEIGLDIALAHCNFKLRGKASDDDQQFVEALGLKLNVEVFVQEFDTEAYAKLEKLSMQMAARELRYTWFEELCTQLHFDYLLTAHHADDNFETFLINVIRGSGIDGLNGIPVINDNIVRPLLPFSRTEIMSWAESSKINWREDQSNASTKYLRNKLRHEVMPILKSMNPQLLEGFASTTSHLREAQQIISDRIDEISDQVLEVTPNAIFIDIYKIKELNNTKAYLYFLLKDYGFTEWNDVNNLLDAQSGAQIYSQNWRLIKDREHLILTKQKETFGELKVTEELSTIELNNGTLLINKVSSLDDVPISANIIYVDGNKVSFPLSLRKWKEGDWFYPLGMQGKKKVSKYFKDEKFSLIDKEETWLLCSGEDIVWVVNHRADDRFKVTNNTSSVLQFMFK